MPRRGARVIQDPVHGPLDFRYLESLVVELLDANEIQRLRRVKQTGFTNFVFPGCEHTRFTHCLGASHVAARIGRQLEDEARRLLPPSLCPKEEELRDFCVAALCHDLGHGPFSHVWEKVIIGDNWNKEKYAKALGLPSEPPYTQVDKWHELVTLAILAWPDGHLHKLLEGNEHGHSARIINMLSGTYHIPYFTRLLHSDIDVDRMDYLLRDSYFAGLPYGRFQIDRLISSMTFGFDSNYIPQVGIDPGSGLHPAIELLRGRMTLHRVLYRHRAVQGMEQLLAKLLERLRHLGLPKTKSHISHRSALLLLNLVQGEDVPIDQLVSLDDHSMWVLISEIAESQFDLTASTLANRILHRDPLRSVRLQSKDVRQFSLKTDAHDRIQNVIARHVPGNPLYYYYFGYEQFTLLEDRELHKALCINIDPSNRHTAFPLRGHSDLKDELPSDVDMGYELLVIREATEDVRTEVTRALKGS